ncbi:unnamed protein product [Protopolystoma xenopodis]|uniref:Uncharacterized protein n=1 Tax=Protopolystoma xenopodis TaxID=117903 RepID=A0A3S5AJ61_9PLAT|nr:unnamed protein product [Protopolystoma xenopodis]
MLQQQAMPHHFMAAHEKSYLRRASMTGFAQPSARTPYLFQQVQPRQGPALQAKRDKMSSTKGSHTRHFCVYMPSCLGGWSRVHLRLPACQLCPLHNEPAGWNVLFTEIPMTPSHLSTRRTATAEDDGIRGKWDSDGYPRLLITTATALFFKSANEIMPLHKVQISTNQIGAS